MRQQNLHLVCTHSLRDLRGNLRTVVRAVTATGEEAILTDSGIEGAVIISLADYERLHEHTDVVDALRLRDQRANPFRAVPLAEMLDELGVDADSFAGRMTISCQPDVLKQRQRLTGDELNCIAGDQRPVSRTASSQRVETCWKSE